MMAKKTAREKQLDTLLRIRRLEEDLAKGELAKANAATRTAYRRLEQSQETYQREVRPRNPAMSTVFARTWRTCTRWPAWFGAPSAAS